MFVVGNLVLGSKNRERKQADVDGRRLNMMVSEKDYVDVKTGPLPQEELPIAA